MEKNAMAKVLEQIAEIMQMLYDNAEKPIPPEKAEKLEKQLLELEKKMELFKKKGEEFTKEWGSSDYALKTLLEGADTEVFDFDQIENLKKAELLKEEAEKASKDFQKAASDAKAAGTSLSEKIGKPAKKKSPQARKGKFKSMGGYKDWKPL